MDDKPWSGVRLQHLTTTLAPKCVGCSQENFYNGGFISCWQLFLNRRLESSFESYSS